MELGSSWFPWIFRLKHTHFPTPTSDVRLPAPTEAMRPAAASHVHQDDEEMFQQQAPTKGHLTIALYQLTKKKQILRYLHVDQHVSCCLYIMFSLCARLRVHLYQALCLVRYLKQAMLICIG